MVAQTELAAGELASFNPATLERVGSVPVTDPAEVQEAVAEARLAHERWRRTEEAERSRLLRDVASVLLEHMDEIAEVVTAESGKPLVESYNSDVVIGVDNATWLAKRAGPVLRRERLAYPQLFLRHKRGFVDHEPLGAVAVIAPWNFPFSIAFTMTATAVAAGNAVLVKPAEETPLSGAWVERAFVEAGAPSGLVRVLQGSGDTVGAALVRARGLAKIFFTGSVGVGRDVAAAAAERMRPVMLELGGKDPMVVFGDADLERAVAGAAWGSFFNCGQVCSGVERIYVQRDRYDDFVTALGERAAALRIGDGSRLETELGPLITEAARMKVDGLVADAAARGAGIVTGGAEPDVGLPGWFYRPTVLTGPLEGARVLEEEIFGPLVTVEPFADEADAVRLANASTFGLGASVWTRDLARAERVAAALEAGSVWTNDHAYSYAAGQVPWGGVKESGMGRAHSKYGLYEASRVKFIELDSGRLGVPWWFPYDRRAVEGFQGFLGLFYGRAGVDRARAAWRHRRGLLGLARRYVSRP